MAKKKVARKKAQKRVRGGQAQVEFTYPQTDPATTTGKPVTIAITSASGAVSVINIPQ